MIRKPHRDPRVIAALSAEAFLLSDRADLESDAVHSPGDDQPDLDLCVPDPQSANRPRETLQ